jgi:hypothetical protein
MAFKDALLLLITYPKATDPAGIQNAVSFAIYVKARMSCCCVRRQGPRSPPWVQRCFHGHSGARRFRDEEKF